MPRFLNIFKLFTSLLMITSQVLPSFVAVAQTRDNNTVTPTVNTTTDNNESFDFISEPVDNTEDDKLVEGKPLDRSSTNKVDTNEMAMERASQAPPTEADGSKIETLTASWISGNSDTLTLKWDDDLEKIARVRWNYALSGQNPYEPGTVRFIIPKQIFSNREGNLVGNMSLAVPEAPDRSGLFAYIDKGSYYIITNTKRLGAASQGMFEATFRGLIPHTIKDMATGYITDEFNATLQVDTQGGTLLEKRSNNLVAKVDTTGAISTENLKGNYIYRSVPEHFPKELLPANPDDYIYADYTSYVYSTANQTFNIDVSASATSDGVSKSAVVLGYKDSKSGRVFKGTGNKSLNASNVFQGYEPNGFNFYGTTYVAFPKSDFEDTKSYNLSVTTNYKMTTTDDNTVSNSTATATLIFTPAKYVSPNGHFYTDKYGDGNVTEWEHGKYLGVYSSALNRIQKGQPVDLKYTLNTRAYGYPWTKRPADEDVDANYNRIPYKITVTDDKVVWNSSTLTPDDFSFKSLQVDKPTLYEFTRYKTDGFGYYEAADGSVKSGTLKAGETGYVLDNDASHIPNVEVYGKTVNDNDYIKFATISYTSGKTVITPENGASVDGDSLVFPENIIDYKVETETTAGAIKFYTHPTVHLNANAKIKGLVDELYQNSDTPTALVSNFVSMNVTLNGKDTFVNTDYGRDRLEGFSYGVKLKKDLTYESDVKTRRVNLHYTGLATSQTNITSEKELQSIIDDGMYNEEKTATWYDLLPVGVIPNTRSIKLRDGDSVQSIELFPNYKNTGRILMKVVASLKPDYRYKSSLSSILGQQGLADEPRISFDATYSWNSLSDNGTKLDNKLVYQSANTQFGTVENLRGEPDNPTARQNRYSIDAVGDLADALTNLDSSTDSNSFIYAHNETDLVVDTYTLTSLQKEVDVNNENAYSDGLVNELPKNVYEGGFYKYRIGIKNSEIATSKDLIFYDNLENYVPTSDKDDFGDKQWRGKLQNIDVSGFEAKGVKPIIYYSTKKNLVLDDETNRTHLDLTNTSIWSTTKPDDLSTVTAIAIDARQGKDGNPFVLQQGDSMNAYIQMQAPFVDDIKGVLENKDSYYDKSLALNEKEKGFIGGAHAYNNVSMTSVSTSVSTGTDSENLLVRHDYVKVGLKPYKIHVEKTWNDEDNRDGVRPKQVTVKLVANGKETNKSILLNDSNKWKDVFENVPVLDRDGNPIVYTLKEDVSNGYVMNIKSSKEVEDGYAYTIENYREPERITISGKKLWVNDEVGTRANSVLVNLRGNGGMVQQKTVKPENNEWNYSFENLYKYERGKPIVYEVSEATKVPGYYSEVEGYNVKNIYHPKGNIHITKTVNGITQQNTDNMFEFKVVIHKDNGDVDSTEYKYTTSDGRNGVVSSGGSISLKQGQEATIADVHSEYTYTITEREKAGYTPKQDTFEGVVRPKETSEVAFENDYSTKGNLSFDVTKELQGRQMKPYQFIFDVKDANGQIIRSGSNDKDGNVIFSPIRYTLADVGKTYVYTIQERDRKEKGITYDTHIETVRVTVSDNGDGTISPNVTYDNDGANFVNSYNASGSLRLKAWKIMRNNAPLGEYRFEIRKKGSNDVVATGVNDTNGEINFTPIALTSADVGKTYEYVASEVVDNTRTDVIFDQSTISYFAEIVDNGDGTIGYNLTIRDNLTSDANNDANNPLFVNSYKSGALTVEKRIISGDTNEEFTFKVKMTSPDGALLPNGRMTGVRKQLSTDTPRVRSPRSLAIMTDGEGAISNNRGSRFYSVNAIRPETLTVVKPPESVTDATTPSTTVNLGITAGTVQGSWDSSTGILEISVTGTEGTLSREKFRALQFRNDVKQIRFVNANSKTLYLPSNSSLLFQAMSKLTSVDGISELNTSKVESMSSMFNGATGLTTLDIGKWDTSNVTSMSSMFNGATGLTTLDVSKWDTSKVTYMTSMFDEAKGLTTLDIGKWNTSNVTNMSSMFRGATGLTTLDISKWNTSKVTYMSSMFRGAKGLTTLDIGESFSKTSYKDNLFDSLYSHKYGNKYTTKWVREDGTYGPYTTDEWDTAYRANPQALAGRWVREKRQTTYTVNFNSNQGVGSATPIEQEINTNVILPFNNFNRFNYDLKGFSTVANPTSERIYTKTDNVQNLAQPGQIVTLYAIWTPKDNSVNIQNGEFEFTLKPNESFTLDNIPAGVKYEVYEKTKEGWNLVNTSNTAGTIRANQSSTATFTNDYQPNKATTQITGNKVMENKQDLSEFQFTLKDNQTNRVLQTVNASQSGGIVFQPIEYTTTGVYNYTIQEAQGTNNTITYDTKQYNVKVTVTRDTKGNLVATQTLPEAIVFRNQFKPVTVHVTKEVTNEINSQTSFTYTINGENKTIKQGQDNTIQVPRGSKLTLQETNIPQGYKLNKYIINGHDSQDVNKITINDETTIKIVNVKEEDTSVEGYVTITGKKVLENGTLQANQFKFNLLDENNRVIATTTNEADGTIRFTNIQLSKDQVGKTLQWRIEETEKTVPNIIYDDHTETVQVSVTKDTENNLSGTVTYDTDGVVFNNRQYDPNDTDDANPTNEFANVTIHKTLENVTEANKDKEFPVTVTLSAKGSYEYETTKGRTGTVKNGDTLRIRHNETITVKRLPLNSRVSLEETNPQGYTLSERSKTALQVSRDSNELNLINVYQAFGSWKPQGKKRLKNGELRDYVFNFLILDNGKILQKAQSDVEGNINFDNINYTAKDVGKTFTYTIIEQSSKNSNIIYDTTEYTIQVRITDDGEGNITAIADNNNELSFVNTVKQNQDIPETGTFGAMTYVLLSALSFGAVFFVRKKRA